jgi:nucleotide-binding universal stress UspA family protein
MKANNVNILLPTDFSDNSWNAVVYVLKLYEDQECTFYFLHSTKIMVSRMAIITGKLSAAINETAMKELLELKELSEVSDSNQNHRFEVVLSSEALNEAIQSTVRKYNIDLVVMGTKGATGAKEILFGSNTVKVIKKIRICPVLIVPDAYDFVLPKQIAFPTDFNRIYNHIEIKPLKSLAMLYNSKIRIVHIEKEKQLSHFQEDNMEALKNFLNDLHCSFHWMPNYTYLADEINVFIEELKIDMLVMVNYKHSFIENIINEPVIKKIGFHPMIPFLVIPD